VSALAWLRVAASAATAAGREPGAYVLALDAGLRGLHSIAARYGLAERKTCARAAPMSRTRGYPEVVKVGTGSRCKNDRMETTLLDENAVVRHICAALTSCGWNVERFAHTSQTGVDVVAVRKDKRIYIEAKGITSSKPDSSRFGSLQTSSQIFIQVAAALLKTAEMRAANPKDEVAMALPDHPAMRRRIAPIESVLEAARIGVLWVADNGSVASWNSSAIHGL
jgi:hypothetical protein